MNKENKPKTVADNETFVGLVRVAQEDPAIRDQILSVVQQPAIKRHTTIRAYVSSLHTQGAPEDFISAVASLLNDEVAEKIRQLLGG